MYKPHPGFWGPKSVKKSEEQDGRYEKTFLSLKNNYDTFYIERKTSRGLKKHLRRYSILKMGYFKSMKNVDRVLNL